MLFSCIVWLKLEDVPSISPYVGNPYDTYFKSLVYFMVAPTLCYQSSYPRTDLFERDGWFNNLSS
ncbi:hypothetical protein NC653_018135 [Populus alba x Populus x berolinensis]|uniref:Uncharacterized protein n=1 Tax=Populus alba x Populus x berolinensis TaxID=444605 RepID=A0AAD6QSU1_9ROSI|nr:hypothetical protein NC653_018135 [Populus alba x Populus x berolinensis]